MPDKFSAWVTKTITTRKEYYEAKNNLMVEITPEFEKIIKETGLLGKKRGRGAHLMKQSAKRRLTLTEKKARAQEAERISTANTALRANYNLLVKKVEKKD